MACSLSASVELSRVGGRLSSQARYSSCRPTRAATAAAQRSGRGAMRRRTGVASGHGILLTQLGAAPGLALGRAHRDRTEATSGHAGLPLSIVTVTFPGTIRGELASGCGTSRLHSCIRGVYADPDHDAAMRIGGEVPGRRAHSLRRRGSHACLGSPPPRIVIGARPRMSRRRAEVPCDSLVSTA
jgi:hypothetical protein